MSHSFGFTAYIAYLCEMKEVLKPEVTGEFNITGRGLAIVINLPAKMTNREVFDLYYNNLVEYKGKINKVVGVERMGMPDRIVSATALLLKPTE